MVKRKKILYLITKSVWGGAGKYVFDLATHAPSSNFEVKVAAGKRDALAKKLSAQNIDYFEIKGLNRDIKLFGDVIAFLHILQILFKTKPDILHASSPKAAGLGGLAFLIYKFLTFRFDARSIYTIHGWVFNEPRSGWQKFILRNASRLICFFYDHIIVLAQSEYEIAKRLWILPTHKMIVIHNGIDPKSIDFLPREEAYRKLIEIHNMSIDRHIVIGTIGEFTKNKGYHYLIDAIKLLQATSYELRAILIARGEEKSNLKSQTSNLGLDETVFFIENLSPASPYLKAFDIFVLPSLKEGLPYVLLEAGLAQLPVIATDVGGNTDIIEHEKTGLLVPAANSEALAEAIKRLLNDVNLRQTLAQNLREKILRKFSKKEMLQKTFALYKKITEGRKKTDS
ncbi:glycosyltransferase family 4 protein [Patescibacteria group bacterium]|nr:glycosyltransferase family 4 protein [Patescibacteria group bacterium]